MPTPYLAASLVRLRNEVNFRWPHRDKSSDGWIGDPAHMLRTSDHNPDEKGCVHALDVDSTSVNVDLIRKQAVKHPATAYVISNKVIYSRTNGFVPKPYTGVDPHTSHIHVSISHTAAAEAETHRWLPVWPVLRVGSTGSYVKIVQQVVGVTVDGNYGPVTEAAVKEFQGQHGLPPDGVVGTATWKAVFDAYA